ncbi:MAG: hypothetical protein WC805_00755 [Patescibacteria group bacterium]|jgi:hypothetical protein
MHQHQLKLAGLVAGVIVVVGVLSILVFTPDGISGISADIGEKPSLEGYALISKPVWEDAVIKLKSYQEADNNTREQIIQEVLQVLESAQVN